MLEERTLLSFLPAVTYPAGSGAISVAVGDFNGDGRLDLAVADAAFTGGTPGVSVLLGNGDGSFQAPVSYPTGVFPIRVAVGDFNGDGVPDLAVGNYGAGRGSLSILLGNGDGTFQAAVNYTGFTSNVGGVAVGDFNNDGKLDLAVADGSVVIFLGNGDGTFQQTGSYGTGYGVAAADFNGDGNLDLAVNSYVNNRVSELLGNGDGTFQAGQTYSFRSPALDPAIGDFNNDGNLDVAISSNTTGTGYLGVGLGNGDGTFQPHTLLTAGSGPQAVAVGDFNGDGHADLTVVNYYDNTVDVFLGNGDGSFQAALTYSTGGVGPNKVALGDFNGDGLPDLVVTNQVTNSVGVLLNAGDWNAAPSTGLSRAHPDANPLDLSSGLAFATEDLVSAATLAPDAMRSLPETSAIGALVATSGTATQRSANPGAFVAVEATESRTARAAASQVGARPLTTPSTPDAFGASMGDLLGDPLAARSSPEGA